jgi:polysaccharide pyruvyl transferase WcaK-like protein
LKILVYGWYHQGNIGDDLFIEAYQHLFPDFEFMFTEHIVPKMLENVDAVFFGGGSFLLGRPQISEDAIKELKNKKVFYLGIGVESEIHPTHMELMTGATMIATRSPEQIDKLKLFNKNVSYIPDLVYSLQSKIVLSKKKTQSVLIMPNVNVVPQRSDPHWRHASWAYFKSEFTQFMDWLVENGYDPTLLSMCRGIEVDDDWAAQELIGHMEKRNHKYLFQPNIAGIGAVTSVVSRYNILVTQRFHGIVLAEMTRTPYVAIHHHDKLKFSQPSSGTFLSYYNSSKQSFITAFEHALRLNFPSTLPIESTIFETFSKEVTNLI